MPRPLSSPRGRPSPRAPPSRRNVAVLSHAEYVPTLTAAAALRVKAALSEAAWWPWPLTFPVSEMTYTVSSGTLNSTIPYHFDLESGVRVTCDVGYLCANFGLPRPLCSRFRPDVRDRQTDRQTDRQASDRQTDVRQKHRLMPPPIRGGGIITQSLLLLLNTSIRHNEQTLKDEKSKDMKCKKRTQ